MFKLASWSNILATAASLAACLVLVRVDCARSGERVIGGHEPRPGQFPFMAQVLRRRNSLVCGGSILDERHILSAAHCFVDDDNQLKRKKSFVSFGCNDRRNCSEFLETELILHPKLALFKYVGYLYDLAILRTAKPIRFNNLRGEGAVNKVRLPESMDNDHVAGQNLTAIGWGATETDGSLALKLRAASLQTVPLAKCRPQYPLVDETVICAGGSGTNNCHGDSGGPLVRSLEDGTHVLVAVVSYSDDCGNFELGGVKMRVAASLDWIRRTMAEVRTERLDDESCR